jgi:hypothetical protein
VQIVEPVFLYIVAYEPKYLDLVFAGLVRQSRRPDRVVLTCDNDRAELGEAAQRWAGRIGAPVSWVRRAHHGVARCSQVRNNAVRHLLDLGHEGGRIIQIDADIVCEPRFVEKHAELGRGGKMVYGHRVNLTEEQSRGLDAEALAGGSGAGRGDPPTPEGEVASLRHRQRRAQRHLVQRALRIGPPHKPKLLGCNWSAPLAVWRDINGHDEHFQGWGYLDDEFARRAYLAGARCVPAMSRIIAWHLYHPTRQPEGPMTANPNHDRFIRKDLPVAAANGLKSPLDQHPVQVTIFEA